MLNNPSNLNDKSGGDSVQQLPTTSNAIQQQQPPAVDDSIQWDESLLTTSFDNQLKLLDPNATTTTTYVNIKETTKTNSHKPIQLIDSTPNINNDSNKKGKKRNRPKPKERNEFFNKSQIFRFEDNDDNQGEMSTSRSNSSTLANNTTTQALAGSFVKETKRKEVEFTPPPPNIGGRNVNLVLPNSNVTSTPPINIMPPPLNTSLIKPENEEEAQASMLMAWYVAGYHTGYFEALKKFQKK